VDNRWAPTPSAAPAHRRMPWRNSPRSRRTPPAGFIQPCQPTLVAYPPAGPGWLHEVKHDGYRLIARKDTGRVVLWSRYGTDFTDKLPRIVEAVRNLPVNNALIDGEAMVFRLDGHSNFVALRTKAGGELACLVAFDLLSLECDDLRQQPLTDRREALEQLVAGRQHPVQQSPRGRRRGRVRPGVQAGPGGNCNEARLKPLLLRAEPQLAEGPEPRLPAAVTSAVPIARRTASSHLEREKRPPQPPPQTGTGTAQRTAISTVASTAVIFSLVDRSMASLRTRCQPQRRRIRCLSCLRCDGDHAPTGCLSCLPAKPACRLWRLTYEPAPRRAGLSAA
jgi:hypothetical protein